MKDIILVLSVLGFMHVLDMIIIRLLKNKEKEEKAKIEAIFWGIVFCLAVVTGIIYYYYGY